MAAKRSLFCFGCHAGQQGLQPLIRDQSRIEKYATGTNFSNKQHDLQDIKLLNIDSVEWMREKYRKVIYTFCYFLKNPSTYDLTGNAFTVLQSRNPENYKYLDLNRQANVRSGIC